jgi:WD40 repeat protein
MASADDQGEIILWKTSTAQRLTTLTGHTGSVHDLCFSPDGHWLASAGDDHTIRLWNVDDGKGTLLATLDDPVLGIAFHPDGRRLAAGGRDSLIHIFDVSTEKELTTLPGHMSFVHCVDFSPDGMLLASGGQDSTVRLWDVAQGAEVATLPGHDSYVLDVAFSRVGGMLATASQDNSTILWDVATRQIRFRFKGHNNFVTDVAFDPQGRRLISAGLDGAVKVWDCQGGQEVLSLDNNEGPVLCVAMDSSGNHIASGGDNHRILVYEGTAQAESELTEPTNTTAEITTEQRARLKASRYEFGWAAGSANAEDELSTSFYPVTTIDLQGSQATIVYAWMDGVIRGQLQGQEIRGTWIQSNGRGEIYLRFDEQFQKATGWWNEGGETPRHAAFLRPLDKTP